MILGRSNGALVFRCSDVSAFMTVSQDGGVGGVGLGSCVTEVLRNGNKAKSLLNMVAILADANTKQLKGKRFFLFISSNLPDA